MELFLDTVARRSDGTLSALSIMEAEKRPFAVTLEPADPVIPAGRWRCKKTFFIRGGYPTFEILIPNHSRVMFHRGNVQADTRGCPVVAESFAVIAGKVAVAQSRDGFDEFWDLVKDVDEFDLIVSGR